MHACGRRNEEIRLTEGDAPFAASRHEAAPFQDHILVDWEHASLEPGPQFLIQPCLERRPLLRVGLSLDAEPNLGHRDLAEEQAVRYLHIRPRLHPGIGPGLAQFRRDVGVEQPSAQKSTSRTGLRTESPPNSRLANGDRDRRSCRVVADLRVRRRSNSSAATTTTALRPRTVTRCGWPAAARRTTSLNRAFASASFQPSRAGSVLAVRGRSGSRLPFMTILVKNRRDGEGVQVQARRTAEARRPVASGPECGLYGTATRTCTSRSLPGSAGSPPTCSPRAQVGRLPLRHHRAGLPDRHAGGARRRPGRARRQNLVGRAGRAGTLARTPARSAP